MRRPPSRRRGRRLESRTALITGAVRGRGAATAHELAARGAQVVIADRDLRATRAAAAALPLGRGRAVECDVAEANAAIDTDMIRDGIDTDPHVPTLLSASPKFMLKRIRPEAAATSLVDGIESRRRSLTVPSRWVPVSALRGVVGSLLDSRYTRNVDVRRALSEMETHHLATHRPVTQEGTP